MSLYQHSVVVDIKVLQNRTAQATLPTSPLTLLWWAVRAGYFSCTWFSRQCFCECFTFLCDLLRWIKHMGNALCMYIYIWRTHTFTHTLPWRQIRVSNESNCTFEQTNKHTQYSVFLQTVQAAEITSTDEDRPDGISYQCVVFLPDSLIDTPLVSSKVTLTLLLVALKPVTVNAAACLFPRYS